MRIAQSEEGAPGSLNRYLKITLYRTLEMILPDMNDRIRHIFFY